MGVLFLLSVIREPEYISGRVGAVDFSTIKFHSMDPPESSRKSRLSKSQACFNCRRRKVKCDGKKPVCTPCARFLAGGLHDCEYTETGLAQSQVLEEKISIIESRIRELEKPNERTSVGLHRPYQSSSSNPGFDEFGPGPSASRSQYHPPQPQSPGLFEALFLRHSSRLRFFLDPQMFEALSAGAAPIQLACPALLGVIYLWGAHLSRSDTVPKASLLSDALRSSARSLSNNNCPDAILQTMQAEMLLAQYFFHNARMLEGKYHASAAMSIALSSGFHKIRSADAVDLMLTTADSDVREGDRINAFWTVLTLNNTWLTADGSPPNVLYAVVDTPWPLDIHADSQVLPLHSSATIENFLSNLPDDGTSLVALHAKAAIAFEQASRLAVGFTENTAHRNSNTFTSEFRNLDRVIETLKQTLPPLDSETDGSHSLLVIHTLTQVATIQLHNPFCLTDELSRSRVISAARTVVELIRQTNLRSDFGYIDAIVGTLWMAACQVFITELSRVRHGSFEAENVQQFHDAVETLLAAMSVFARDCRMIELQLGTAQRNYAAIRNQ
ncbi:hypothetical protein K438DRAFT_1941215 [Mycena galopus ATCC 62051]|nr:hypothetical protein K438DRAFT_1941215 [Mycena galopus ATCC 62051]